MTDPLHTDATLEAVRLARRLAKARYPDLTDDLETEAASIAEEARAVVAARFNVAIPLDPVYTFAMIALQLCELDTPHPDNTVH